MKSNVSSPKTGSIRQAFGHTINHLAHQRPNLFVVSVGLRPSVALDRFATRFRKRFVEVGVAENNAAGISAGLAKTDKIVFLATYACFSPGINLATIKQSICENHANVKIVGTHGGLATGDLGVSHQMLEDIALMRSLPNMQVFAPIDSVETDKIITTVTNSPHPAYVRLVRPINTPIVFPKRLPFTIGQSHILQSGTDITVLGYGPILTQALEIKNYKLEIINCSSIKPLDQKTILASIRKTRKVIVIEDHQKIGGLGEAVASLLLVNHLSPKFIHLAVNDQFGQSARDYQELYDHYGIGLKSLQKAIHDLT